MNSTDQQNNSAWQRYRSKLVRAGFALVDSCNSSKGTGPPSSASCSAYPDISIQKQKSYTLKNQCPFRSETCFNYDEDIFRADTGLLDSHQDFDIDMQDRILIRKILDCAPIKTTRYMTSWGFNFTSADSTMDYNYGVSKFDSNSSATMRIPAVDRISDGPVYKIEYVTGQKSKPFTKANN